MYHSGDSGANTPAYNSGDVVWVKLGACWWPGEVKISDDLPSDMSTDFKKPPLVIVKFFDEDSYEYVKNWAHIYPYNCVKKIDFIKKGMAAFRAKLSHMTKFPKDVSQAEERTNGNPNILSDPVFLPAKKFNYTEIFGAPSPKKPKSTKSPVKKSPAMKESNSHITHRRFIGNDDYQAIVCIQYPGKDRRQGENADEEARRVIDEPADVLACQVCPFKTRRIEVMRLHAKMHIQGAVTAARKKPRKLQSIDRSDSSPDVPNMPRPKPRKKKPVENKKELYTDLLEEWNDTDEETSDLADISKQSDGMDEPPVKDVDDLPPTGPIIEESQETENRHVTSETRDNTTLKNTVEDIKNCFDFEEEEEEEDISVPVPPGRKIPRVIPEKSIEELKNVLEGEDDFDRDDFLKITSEQSTEELKSVLEADDDDINKEEVLKIIPGKSTEELKNVLEAEDDDINREEILRVSDSFNRMGQSEPEALDASLEESFKEVMEKTAVPNVEDLVDTLKPEQNFHDGRTVKFPDKGNSITSTPLTAPKKRYVKSFEDFEMELRRKEHEYPENRNESCENQKIELEKKEALKEGESLDGTSETEKMKEEATHQDEEIRLILEETVKQIVEMGEKEETESPLSTNKKSDTSGEELKESQDSKDEEKLKTSNEEHDQKAQNEPSVVKEDNTSSRRKTRHSIRSELPEDQDKTEKTDSCEDHSQNEIKKEEPSLEEVKPRRRGRHKKEVSGSLKIPEVQAKKEAVVEIERKSRKNIRHKHEEERREIVPEEPKSAEGRPKRRTRISEEIRVLEETLRESAKAAEQMEAERQLRVESNDVELETKEDSAAIQNIEQPISAVLKNDTPNEPAIKATKYHRHQRRKGRQRRKTEEKHIEGPEVNSKPDSSIDHEIAEDQTKEIDSKSSDVSAVVPEEVELDDYVTTEEIEQKHLPESTEMSTPHEDDEISTLDVSEDIINSSLVSNEQQDNSCVAQEAPDSKLAEESSNQIVDISKQSYEMDEPAVKDVDDLLSIRPSTEKSHEIVSHIEETVDVSKPEVEKSQEEVRDEVGVSEEKIKDHNEILLESSISSFVEDVSQIPLPPGEPPEKSFPAEDTVLVPKLDLVGLSEETVEKSFESVPAEIDTEDKSVPPKKNMWTRRNSHPKKDRRKIEDILIETNTNVQKSDKIDEVQHEDTHQIISDTELHKINLEDIPLPGEEKSLSSEYQSLSDDIFSEKMAKHFTVSSSFSTTLGDVELILPLKKSRRLNEVTSLFDEDSFPKVDVLPGNEPVHISSNITDCSDQANEDVNQLNDEPVPEEIRIEPLKPDEPPVEKIISEPSNKKVLDVVKGVPPKKKKMEIPLEDLQVETELIVAPKQISDEIPQAPKKKMQKLFENSQALEKTYMTDLPQMSPLAKKKSFAFHEEMQELQYSLLESKPQEEVENKEDILEEKRIEEPSPQSAPEDSEVGCSPAKKSRLSEDDDKSPETSSLFKNHNTHELKDIEVDIGTIEDNVLPFDIVKDEQSETKPAEKEPPTKEETESKDEVPKEDPSVGNEMEVNLEEDDFKFSIQTNLTNLSSSNPEALSALVQASLSEIEHDKVDEPKEAASEVVDKADHDTALVQIEGNLTVMSEKDLADAQVEITTEKVISEKKPLTLGTFSMDFSESSSSSADFHEKKTSSDDSSLGDNTGTEFPFQAMTKELITRPLISQPKAYERTELLDILEGNSNSSSSSTEQRFKKSFDSYEKKDIVQGVQGICDFEECIPSQIVVSNKSQNMDQSDLDSSKLLERLTMEKSQQKVVIQSDVKVPGNVSKMILNKMPKTGPRLLKNQKFVIKSKAAGPKVAGSKPIILSEKIIKPANAPSPPVTAGVKRPVEDIEDVEAFVIPKTGKKVDLSEDAVDVPPPPKKVAKSGGKAKILQQTIITPEGEIIQPQTDDGMFDINSMPIVLSDEILTPESIEKMSVVISNEVIQSQAANPKGTGVSEKPVATKKPGPGKLVIKQGAGQVTTTKIGSPKPRILASSANRIIKQGPTPLLPNTKSTKYILVPSSCTSGVPQGKVLSTKQALIRKQSVGLVKTTAISSAEGQAASGNKIMIVTNQQGQQQRLLLTPAQQKMLGMQGQQPKVTKTIVKGPIPKGLLQEATPGPSGITQKSMVLAQKVSSVVSSTITTTQGGLLPLSQAQKTTSIRTIGQKTPGKKTQKTILIKNQHGQTVRKIQGTDDDELDRQVAEQLEAIKASARLQQSKPSEIINYSSRSGGKGTVRRSYAKKVEPLKTKLVVTQQQSVTKSLTEPALPALSPLTTTTVHKQTTPHILKKAVEKSTEKVTEKVEKTDTIRQAPLIETSSAPPVAIPGVTEPKSDRPLNQLIIQDAMGNQTTITEGQILALPSETVDGQPQSYMLITLDESGNLTPLNNEALMSLDPSLGLGGDINNMVLQVDQGQGVITAASAVANKSDVASAPIITDQQKVAERLKGPIIEPKELNQSTVEPKAIDKSPPAPVQEPVPSATELQVSVGEGAMGDSIGGQQLIVTGDPIATQKFLESLSEGTTDLASILANADGGSILIQADGQQILIKTNSNNGQSMMDASESSEGGGNPVFSSQHKPNQDILAAALANTDMFQQQEPLGSQSLMKGMQPSQLSPSGGALFPMHVGNVLETSLTLSSPIMTPLEVPSTNSKKIDDEVDILNQVPKNVDLPITITDPNISQTVAHQQAAGLMELSLPISESGVAASAEMASPSFAYSLPTIDDAVEIPSKPFNGNMPLLTEDVVEETSSKTSEDNFEGYGSLPVLPEDTESDLQSDKNGLEHERTGAIPLMSEETSNDTSLGSTHQNGSSTKPHSFEDGGLCTLGGEMCSSLSEPPPDMFDLGPVTEKEEEISSDQSSAPEAETLSLNSEGSGEIPLQPHIVAKLSELKRSGEEDGNDAKRPKID